MDSSHVLSVVTFVYGLAAVLYVASLIFKREMPGIAASITTLLGIIGNTAGIGLRWWESHQQGIGHAPLSNLYESLVFFALTIAVIYMVVERKYKNRLIGAFVTPLAFLAMAYASLSPNMNDRIMPLLPALKSNWLIAHVMACFIGYAAFALAFGISIIFLIKLRKDTNGDSILARLPAPAMLNELNYQLIMFGFLFLTVGIITGAVWANSAWGRYWGWDPKETWSLITWVMYAVLLHAKMMKGWDGKRIAYLSMLGFIAVLITYFGVNYLPGLHSYGSQ
ncbi:MAG: c-type cytochrome biogenesis protein CcsB [Desulfobacterium sp.]|nr:c-type cytochrome biogenesis protein CcsB [Desulfobacterium sp.]